ncbi:uncharacterized protein LOC116182483 [Photinus pyralis]|uniref:SGNH hydrolase-type esterase domain-containing protein n=1 Tax=Photinus pyralis TaxID=7054 RepID=A0A1Y1MBF3_PHOPY|nr:uncharacterized protein LOC116164536 [Photinus pyralis]XP_031341654.1 uncharacterized protein LOC116169648 [Photinus pyralis]XP_031341667.1 uncharacterized protein LOC116169648 [Photinus pyralis]XP_031358878.1 uncharacterized protein LOC116182483 [Photinus pyralis]XP_031358879.1 uncharacterized protein LOC116182483 [Photinus pyralis]
MEFYLGDSILRRMLATVCKRKVRWMHGKRLVDLCIGGQTITQLRRRIERSRNAASKWFVPRNVPLVILIGTNDISRGVKASVAIRNLKGLLRTLRKWTLQYRALLCTVPPMIRTGQSVQIELSQYNAAIRDICSNRRDVFKLIDLYALFQCENVERIFERDGIHPNAAGLKKIYRAIRST